MNILTFVDERGKKIEGCSFISLPPENICSASTSTVTDLSHAPREISWSVNDTKLLLDLYDKYKKQLGTFKVKNNKQLYQVIAEELSVILKRQVTPNNCENRWRVVERNYKKYVENQKGTGRSKKYFEYVEEMEKIFRGKRNIQPEILLTSETHHTPTEDIEEIVAESQDEVQSEPTKTAKKRSLTNGRKQKTKSTLENLRRDKKEFFEKKLKLEEAKLEELKRKNEILKERNAILVNSSCCCTKNK